MIRQTFSFLLAIIVGMVLMSKFGTYLNTPRTPLPEIAVVPLSMPLEPQPAEPPRKADDRLSKIVLQTAKREINKTAPGAFDAGIRFPNISEQTNPFIKKRDTASAILDAVSVVVGPAETECDTPVPEIDPELIEQAAAKLTKIIGSAFLVVHTPDTFDIPASWRGADVNSAALSDTIWVDHGSRDQGWAISDRTGKRNLVPRMVLARIVQQIEERIRIRPSPIYRIDVILNSSDIVDVHVEYF